MTRPARLLVVTPSLTGGGAERFTSLLVNSLDRERFEPQVCLMTPRVSYPLSEDIEVLTVHKTRPHHLARSVGRLREIILSSRPDVVLSTMLYPGWLVGAALGRIQSRPRWVARFANPPSREYGFQWQVLKWPLRRIMRRADTLVANSRGLARDIERVMGYRSGGVDVAYNPLDFDDLEQRAGRRPAEDDSASAPPSILSVGRLSPQKRPDLLLEAFSLVVKQQPARLQFCGDGPLRPKLQKRARRLGLSNVVEFLGFQDNPHQWMRRSSIFALTSDYEGLPNALIEAQGLGLPAVSTNCLYGPDEIIDNGETGLLVPPGDSATLADAMADLISSPGRLRMMGEMARSRTRDRFELGRVVPTWEALLLSQPTTRAFQQDGQTGS